MTFFFSSRRRHTRYWRDWSSDVCSSDLFNLPDRLLHLHLVDARQVELHRVFRGHDVDFRRSEERRVGKECSTRGSPAQQKEKDDLSEELVAENLRLGGEEEKVSA